MPCLGLARDLYWVLAMKGDDIAERLLNLASGVLRVVADLPSTPAGGHICGQLVASGTSGGANYEEARAAQSCKDFIHKVGIAAKEVRETRYWLQLTARAGYCRQHSDLPQLIREAHELSLILAASIRTARSS